MRFDQLKETNSTVDIGRHDPAISKVVFVGTDVSTVGNWKGAYGSEGYHVILDSTNYPASATVTPSGKSDWTWDSAPTDTRALQRASSGRIAACWYAGEYFEVALTQNDGRKKGVSPAQSHIWKNSRGDNEWKQKYGNVRDRPEWPLDKT